MRIFHPRGSSSSWFHFPLSLRHPEESGTASRVGLSLIGLAAQGSLRFLTNLVIGRLAGPAALGVSSSVIATAQIASLLGPTTAGSAASKFVARSRGLDDISQATAVAKHVSRVVLAVALCLGSAAAILWAAPAGHGGLAERAVVFVLVLGYSGYSVARGVQFGAGKFLRGTLWDLVTATLGFGGLLICLWADVRPVLALTPVAIALLTYSLSGVVVKSNKTVPWALKREIWAFVLMGILGTLCSAGLLQGGVLMAQHIGGAASAGHYASAMTLATPMALVGGSISLALFPRMSQTFGSGNENQYRSMTTSAVRTVTAIVPLIFGPMVICAHSIERWVWGTDFQQHPMLLPLLLLACMATTLGAPGTNALTAAGHDGVRRSMYYALLGAGICGTIWLLLARNWGLIGVAIGYLAATVIIWIAPLLVLTLRNGYRLLWQIFSTCACIGALALLAFLANHQSIVGQLMLSALFSSVWLGAMGRPIYKWTQDYRRGKP